MSKEEQIKNGIFIKENNSIGTPLVKYPIIISDITLRKILTKEMWNELKFKKSKFNNSINDLLKENNLTLPDSDVK